jgi:hypothetical protein
VWTDPVMRAQVDVLLRQAYTSVRELLDQHRAAVIAVAEALIVREDLDNQEIEALIREAEAPSLAALGAAAIAAVPPAGAQNGGGGYGPRVVDGQVVDPPAPPGPPPTNGWTPPNGSTPS